MLVHVHVYDVHIKVNAHVSATVEGRHMYILYMNRYRDKAKQGKYMYTYVYMKNA